MTRVNNFLLEAMPNAAFLCAAFVIGFFAGSMITRNIDQESAVKSGHAEWVKCPHGFTDFKWKEAKP